MLQECKLVPVSNKDIINVQSVYVKYLIWYREKRIDIVYTRRWFIVFKQKNTDGYIQKNGWNIKKRKKNMPTMCFAYRNVRLIFMLSINFVGEQKKI